MLRNVLHMLVLFGTAVALAGCGAVAGPGEAAEAKPAAEQLQESRQPQAARSAEDRHAALPEPMKAELQEAVATYRVARQRFTDLAVDWQASEQAYEEAERALNAAHGQILAYIEQDAMAVADAFRAATAAGTEADQELWIAFIQTLTGLGVIPEARYEARQDALSNVPVIAQFHATYPDAQGDFTYHRGEVGDVWWESVALLHGRYQLDVAVPVRISQDLRRVIEVGEPEFTLSDYEEAEDPDKWLRFGSQTWQKLKQAEGRIEDVFEGIVTDDPIDVQQGLIEQYEQMLAATDDEHERAALEQIIRLMKSRDDITSAQEAAQQHAIENVAVIREFHEHYPDAVASFGGYASGWADSRVLIPWHSEVHLHGRYELTLTMEVGLSEDGRRVVRAAEPIFYLHEREWVQRLPDGRLSISYDPTHVPQQFGRDAWERIVAADGDLSVLGFEVIEDQPVAESPDPAPRRAYPLEPVNP